jgi:hypothetical protein
MPTSWERFARQHPSGPPPSFRPASPCAGIDRPVSGPMTVTPGPFGTPPLTPRGAAGKSVSLRVRASALTLATAMDSPARFPRRTAQPRYPSLVLPRHHGFLRLGVALSSRAVYPHLVSGTFHSPLGVLFSFPSRYLSAIGLGTYLGLEVGYSHLPTPVRTWYSGTRTGLPRYAYGAITLYGSVFQRASARGVRPYSEPEPHTPRRSSHRISVWPTPLSLAGTQGISVDFSSSPY